MVGMAPFWAGARVRDICLSSSRGQSCRLPAAPRPRPGVTDCRLRTVLCESQHTCGPYRPTTDAVPKPHPCRSFPCPRSPLVSKPTCTADANPKVIQAYIDALDEADAYIASNPAGAAEIYARTAKVKTTADEMLEMLKDKDTWFSTTPEGIMKITDFMHQVGSIKVKPASWSDMFVPQLRDRSGS